MELDLYNSSIDGPGMGICIAGGYMLYRTFKHFSTLLITAGFFVIFLGSLSNNFCLGVSQISNYLNDYPYICHPLTSYIRGLGYILVGFGLIKLNQHLKSA